MLPKIGSTAYRALSFHEQLEILSLKLFNPAEYASSCDPTFPTSTAPRSGLKWSIDYPPLPDVAVIDLPVSILRQYWAGYSCYFDKRWYAEDYCGLTPLEDYGIDYKKMVSIWTFTFPILSVTPALHYVLLWILQSFPRNTTSYALLVASKVYLFLEMRMNNTSAFDVFRMYSKYGGNPWPFVKDAMSSYESIKSYTHLNFECPIMEECHELTWFECGEFSLLKQPRYKSGRWYYPMVPTALFSAAHFKISTWQFLK